ncbi:MAG: glycoside hydrolase family 88 protein, partial [Kiritimatiellae bacterium]|nr:glycoside hydrolase family 88 protein [Kiritimatiellia bacterium]
VCGDRYALWTHNTAGRMELAFAKTEDLAAACGRNSLLSLPEQAQPTQVGQQLAGRGQSSLPQLALGAEAEKTLCGLLHPYKLTAGKECQLLPLAEALHRGQREDGLWCKTAEAAKDVQSEPDYARSALFAYVVIEGVRQGLLDVELYAPLARRAWVRLCADLAKPGVADAASNALLAGAASLSEMMRQPTAP